MKAPTHSPSAFTRLFSLGFRKIVEAGAPRRLVPDGVVHFLMRSGRHEVNGVFFRGNRRLSVDRRHKNGGSGDYRQDIFTIHRVFSFLVKAVIDAKVFQCYERADFNYPLE